jgi:hypothetical protein
MDISIYSLLAVLIVTFIYFIFIKPKLTFNDYDTNNYITTDYYIKNIKSLGYYFIFIVFTQFVLNICYLMSTCGSSLDKNIGAAALFTFIPWVLIFGVLLVVLLMFPGFKSAFSDVVGYYFVANKSNEIFSSLLINTDINKMIEASQDETEKIQLTNAAEAIMKICGNKSIIINQMNTDNFLNIWNVLTPLMNNTVKSDEILKNKLKQDLLNLVSLKENIGEGLWYIYTAILISSIVYYNLATRGCVKSVDQIKNEHDTYIKEQEEINKQNELNNTTYVI